MSGEDSLAQGSGLFSAGTTQVQTPPRAPRVSELASQVSFEDWCWSGKHCFKYGDKGGAQLSTFLGLSELICPHLGFLTWSENFLKASGLGSFTCFVTKQLPKKDQSSQPQEATEGQGAI